MFKVIAFFVAIALSYWLTQDMETGGHVVAFIIGIACAILGIAADEAFGD